MGFFRNLKSDLSEIGSTKSKFKKKFTSLFKLLSDYSYNEMPYSKELGEQKINLAYNELLEFSQFVNKSETIKVYFRTQDVDLTIDETLKVAEILTSAVLEEWQLLTNTYALQVMETVKNDYY
jgi:hypothetical protein